MLPQIIQGGMGVHISTPQLARTVSLLGGLGTVSGVAANLIMPRILQNGDPGGDYRRALEHFPFPDAAKLVLNEYFVSGGIRPGESYKAVRPFTLSPSRLDIALLICSNFAFVWLSKEGHDNPISINWLEKMQIHHLYAIYGAMLADIDYVTMGAGIPDQIPGLLEAYANGQAAEYRVTVTGTIAGTMVMKFDPAEYFGQSPPLLRRPSFIPIVSSDSLASIMIKLMKKRKMTDGIQGFVVEGPIAGGHNAPPREKVLGSDGHPVYGPRDVPDFAKLRDLGLPFWIGGGYSSSDGLDSAKSVGAIGIQVGSIFGLSNESGLDPRYRREIIRRFWQGQLEVKTDFHASPTGFPFKVVQLPGTLSDESVYLARHRNCNKHGLVVPHQLADGTIVYRCPAEPIRIYVQHNEGLVKDTIGARCLCNGLMSTAGVGDSEEAAIVTLGDEVGFLRHLTTNENGSYTASQALAYLLGAE